MMCFITAAACCILMAASPPQGQEGAILYLTGAQCLEELDSSVLEHFESLLSHPIRINFASRQVLESSMLLDRLQVNALLDYRRTQGDVLSAFELGLVPGFGPDVARLLEPFLDFSSSSTPGTSSLDGASRGEVYLRYKSDGLSAKARYDWRGRISVSLGTTSGSVVYNGVRGRFSAVVGDFNVRYGQGLCAWTGFSMTSISNVASFCRRAGGIVPGTGYTRSGRLRGVAATYDFGRWSCTGILAGDGAGGNVIYYWRSGQAGLNMLSDCFSADTRITAGRFDLFGELAAKLVDDAAAERSAGLDAAAGTADCSIRLDAVAGAILNTSYDVKWALRGRLLSGKEASAAAGARLWGADLTVETALLPQKEGVQLRARSTAPLKLAPWWTLTLRSDARYRSFDTYSWRTLLRADSEFRYGHWSTLLRADRVHCRDEAIVLLAEEAYAGERLSLWLRGTVFRVDYWDDRIYVWQRDIPGSFNVPAMYGRGWRLGLCGRIALHWGRLDVQFSHTGRMDERSPSNDFKLLYRLVF